MVGARHLILFSSGCLRFVVSVCWGVGYWFNWVMVGLSLRFYADLILGLIWVLVRLC